MIRRGGQASLIPAKMGSLPREVMLRIASGFVLVLVAIAVVWSGGVVLTLFVALALGRLCYEWLVLTRHPVWSASGFSFILTGQFAVLCFHIAEGNSFDDHSAFTQFLPLEVGFAAGVIGTLVTAITVALRGFDARWIVLAGLYLIVPAVGFLWIRSLDGGMALAFWLLVIVWATDIASYAAGQIIKGPQIAPRSSPNKTWSGFLGGLCAGVLAGTGLGLYIFVPGGSVHFGTGVMIVLAFGLALATQAGDIAESWLKRRFDVKDSGGLIPGHGGVLDRLDGFLFAAIVLTVTMIALVGA